jgi:hypothetical protein
MYRVVVAVVVVLAVAVVVINFYKAYGTVSFELNSIAHISIF